MLHDAAKIGKQITAFILFLLIFTGGAMPVFSQDSCTINFSGKVIDVDMQIVLPTASVYIKELKKGVSADDRGIFSIGNICAGKYTVVCQMLGYKPIEVKLNLSRDIKDYTFRLHSEAIELHETIISGKRQEENSTISKSAIDVKELRRNTGKSLGETLKNLEGVTTLQTGSTIQKPVIHGLHSQRIVILNNGVRQEGQQWGTEHAPEVDPAIAEEIIVVKGANAVKYGPDALAGAILIDPKPLVRITGLGGKLFTVYSTNNNLLSAGSMWEGKIKENFFWRTHASVRKAGNIKSPNYYLKNTGFEELSVSSSVGYLKDNWGVTYFQSIFRTKIGIFSAAHIGNLTDLQIAFNSPVPLENSGFTYQIQRPYQQVSHSLQKINGYYYANEKAKWHWQFAYQDNVRDEYDKHGPRNDSLAALNKPELHYGIKTFTADADFSYKFNEKFNITTGISGISQENKYEGRFFIPNYRNRGAGIYSILAFDAEKYHLEGGLRYDVRQLNIFMWERNTLVTPSHFFQNPSANAGISYHFSHHFTASYNAGYAWRPPSPNELYSKGLHHGAAAIEYGNKNLNPETGWNNVVTLNYWHSTRFNLTFSSYLHDIQSYIYLAPKMPAELSIRGAFPAYEYKQTHARLTGADMALEWIPFKQLTFKAKAMYLYAENITANEALINMPANRGSAEIEYSIKDFLKDNYMRFGILHVLKQDRIPANADYILPPNGYTLFNAAAGATFMLGRQPLEIQLSADNLFNTAYREYMNRFRYFADEKGSDFSIRLYMPFGKLKDEI